MKRIVSVLLVAILLLTCLCACAPSEDEGDTTTTTTGSPTQNNSGVTLNPLTGENDIVAGTATRPVAIMVPNDSQVIGYQMGIDKADFYMECETEGAIPRLMTVFAGASRIPETYGPIRSARSPFVTTANELGFVLTFSGATTHVRQKMTDYGLNILNAGAIGNPTFWRDSYLTQHVTNYHNLVTSGEQMTAKLEKMSYSSTPIKPMPFAFGEKAGTATATKFQLNTTPSHRATFIYDSTTGLYGKNIGNMDSCKPHKTLEGNQIHVANVLVLYAPKFVENKNEKTTWYDFNFGSGTGYVFSGGTYRKINYTRSADSLTLTEQSGEQVVLATGKTYMVLADATLESKLIVQ